MTYSTIWLCVFMFSAYTNNIEYLENIKFTNAQIIFIFIFYF